ncbi:Uncharacterized protein FWK35_00002501, partial [Aphis craccivora]
MNVPIDFTMMCDVTQKRINTSFLYLSINSSRKDKSLSLRYFISFLYLRVENLIQDFIMIHTAPNYVMSDDLFYKKFNDSERSDECIDFTMMCWTVSDRKVNVVGTLGGQNVRKNPKRVTEKQEFLRKTSFRPNRYFYMVVNQKLITIYLNFQKKLTFFELFIDHRNFLSINKFWMAKNTLKCYTRFLMIQTFTKSVENAKICNISRRYLNILPVIKIGVFFTSNIDENSSKPPLKHKPPFSPITENYTLG